MGSETTLVLAGDVMTGRGIDQVLAHPLPPGLVERYVTDARTYVRLAEERHGAVPAPVAPSWPWGVALPVMDEVGPSVRVMNLETSVTACEERAPKGVNYRMSPANVAVLTAGRVDVWALANNHVLDHGRPGLLETLATLDAAGLAHAGAGRDRGEAEAVVAVERPAAAGAVGRVLVASVAHVSSGVPVGWGAADGPGIALLRDLSVASAERVAEALARHARAGDVRVVSIHWGGNWGYEVPREQRRFAHRLVEAGVHVVHGHSSHHPRPAEVHREGLVLYGCGDLVDDYEGITGYEQFRPDLRLLYVVTLDATGALRGLRMIPLRARRLRLERASAEETDWLARTLDGAGRALGARVGVSGTDGSLLLRS